MLQAACASPSEQSPAAPKEAAENGRRGSAGSVEMPFIAPAEPLCAETNAVDDEGRTAEMQPKPAAEATPTGASRLHQVNQHFSAHGGKKKSHCSDSDNQSLVACSNLFCNKSWIQPHSKHMRTLCYSNTVFVLLIWQHLWHMSVSVAHVCVCGRHVAITHCNTLQLTACALYDTSDLGVR